MIEILIYLIWTIFIYIWVIRCTVSTCFTLQSFAIFMCYMYRMPVTGNPKKIKRMGRDDDDQDFLVFFFFFCLNDMVRAIDVAGKKCLDFRNGNIALRSPCWLFRLRLWLNTDEPQRSIPPNITYRSQTQ